MARFFALLWLPPFWRYAIFIGLGVSLGLGLVLARMSRMTSYLSDDAKTCINCHVMNDAYMSWKHSSHRNVATCSDCHVPHNNIFAQYAFKACDGFRHSYVFTMRNEPQVLKLSEGAIPVVQNNCIRCHKEMVEMTSLTTSGERLCWDCHHTSHGPLRSLSASPREMHPKLPPAGLSIFKSKDDESL